MKRDNWTDDKCFYATAVNGKQVAFLAGPFKTLAEAESKVEQAKELAIEKDKWAHFYTFGCASYQNGYREGMFNQQLGI